MSKQHIEITTSPWLPFLDYLQQVKGFTITVLPKTNIIYCEKKNSEIIFIDTFWSVTPQGINLALESASTIKELLKYLGYETTLSNDSFLSQSIYTAYIDTQGNFFIFFDRKKNPVLTSSKKSVTVNRKKTIKKVASELLQLVHPCSYVLVDFAVQNNRKTNEKSITPVPVFMSLDITTTFYDQDIEIVEGDFTQEIKHKLLYTLCEDSIKKSNLA